MDYSKHLKRMDTMPAPQGHEAYNTQGEGGRPRRYSTEDIERLADEFKVWLSNPNNVWFKDFCLDRDINPDLMSEWAAENERFGGVYALAKHRQESRLINGGLLSVYNGSIVKLVLFNAHGWSDKVESKISGDSGNPLAFILQNVDGKTKDLVDGDLENASDEGGSTGSIASR
jgi:hypothetical protein